MNRLVSEALEAATASSLAVLQRWLQVPLYVRHSWKILTVHLAAETSALSWCIYINCLKATVGHQNHARPCRNESSSVNLHASPS